MNTIKISGFVREPKLSCEKFNEKFYDFLIESPRQSAIVDEIICRASSMFSKKLIGGQAIEIDGEIRTANRNDNGKNKLLVYVFANRIKTISEEELKGELFSFKNEVEINGFICRKNHVRITPKGREICDFVIASKRINKKNSDYIPCITWRRRAFYISDECNIGDEINATGRLQSRKYEKTFEDGTRHELTAYELSIDYINTLEND